MERCGRVNVQNIPRKDTVVKSGFVPKLDCFLLCDFAQIEYRLLAYYLANAVGDTSMAEVFARGEDLHAASAAAILKKPIEEITDAERQTGKTYNFLTIYGGGPGKAARSLDIPLDHAKEQQEQFHAQWPAIKKLHNPPMWNGHYRKGEGPGLIQRRLKERGYITTVWGGHLHPRSPHMALNALVQGCAADLMKASMVRVAAMLKKHDFESHLVNVVHDELIFDCVEADVDELVLEVERCMCDWPQITEFVPVEVDANISHTSWAEKAEYVPPTVHGRTDDLGQPGSVLAA